MHRMLTGPGRGHRIADAWAANHGTTGIAFTMVLSLCVTFIGAAVDLKRAIDYRTMFQGWADLAVLAGAANYTNSTSSNIASLAVKTFYGISITQQGALSDIVNHPTTAYSVTTSAGTLSSGQSAYIVSISATVVIKTTFMYPLMPSMTIQVNASAANPIVTPVFSASTFNASAGDDNTVYAYPVTLDSHGKPQYSTLPSSSQLYAIGRSNSSFPVATNQIFTPLASTAPIAFALGNITGGVHGYGPNASNCGNNWTNQYGVLSGPGGHAGVSGSGQTNWFYSAYLALGQVPTQTTNYTYTWAGPVKTGSTCSASTTNTTTTSYPTNLNCSFQAAIYVAGSTSYLNPPQNTTCFSASATPGAIYAAMNCQELAGNTLAVWWNDMGGKFDDLDYNDAYFTVTCSGTTSNGAAAVTQVTLLN